MEKITIKIDHQELIVAVGKTILEIATENAIEIPTLCQHPDIEKKQSCGMCIVSIEREQGYKHACATIATEGMEIITASEDILEERKKNLEKIVKKHLLDCVDCVLFQHCKLLELTKKMGVKPVAEKQASNEVFQVGTMIFNQTKCIGCGNCISVCPTDFLSLNGYDKVVCSTDEKIDCISCGQCILHCPIGAIDGVGEFEELEQVFKHNKKITVVQFAPSIRTSIGEEFGMEIGKIATNQLVAALKKVGFQYVFDTATGADFTTMEESVELVNRFSTKEKLPAMSSCCSAWVKFLEFNYPEYIPNLCTSRSPQTMLGGVIKNYWSKLMGIEPKDIFVVSIMPCVAKKYEIKREELKINDVYPVDMVLTTRELVRLLKKHKIDLKNIEAQEADDALGLPSGAGVIYGSSGGVFESAIRTAYFKMTKEQLPTHAVKEIRGIEGIKTKEVQVGDSIIKICVVSGIKNAKKVLNQLKENPALYDAIEFMACPGGCIAGGGQSLPNNKKIIKERSKSLYVIDDKKEMKCAHDNKAVQKVYDDFFTNEHIQSAVLHTYFSQKNKTIIRTIKNSREPYE